MAERDLEQVVEEVLPLWYLSFASLFSPSLVDSPAYWTGSPRILGQDAPQILGNAIRRDHMRPRGQRTPRTSRQRSS